MPRLRDLWFDLPLPLEDVTEYFLTSSSGPILDLPLSLLPLAAENVDAWLLQARDKLKSFRGVNLGALQSYDSPRYRVRGFEADCGSSIV